MTPAGAKVGQIDRIQSVREVMGEIMGECAIQESSPHGFGCAESLIFWAEYLSDTCS